VSFDLPPSLADGNYKLTLAAIEDGVGNRLAATYTFDFFVLAGDINRDRRVDGSDFSLLAGNFGRSGMTYGQGDLTGDGAVNGSDFAILAGNFGKSLPAPVPPAALASTPAPAAAGSRTTAVASRTTTSRKPPVRRHAAPARPGVRNALLRA
jgi:hypothetical protein